MKLTYNFIGLFFFILANISNTNALSISLNSSIIININNNNLHFINDTKIGIVDPEIF